VNESTEVARGRGVVLFREDGELWLEIDGDVWKLWRLGVAGGTKMWYYPAALVREVERLAAGVEK